MNFSKYQTAIFEAQKESNDNLLIEAVAGSGKTTTLLEMLKRTYRSQKSLFLAFNASIKNEINNKIISNGLLERCEAKTLHALGLSLIEQRGLRFIDKVKVYDPKQNKKVFVDNFMPAHINKYEFYTYKYFTGSKFTETQMTTILTKWSDGKSVISNMLDKLKDKDGLNYQSGFFRYVNKVLIPFMDILRQTYPEYVFTEEHMVEVFNKYISIKQDKEDFLIEDIDAVLSFPNKNDNEDGVFTVAVKSMLSQARNIIKDASDNLYFIDFTDMLFIPVYQKLTIPIDMEYDNLFIDECQDLSPVQLAIIAKFKGRKFFVGDRNQAIYGFRGSMTQGMDIIEALFQCTPLPLAVSYRCDKIIIDMAKEYQPMIEARDEANDGVYTEIDKYQDVIELLTNKHNNKEKIMVICFRNLPIFQVAFELMKKGIWVSIPEKVIQMLKNMQSKIYFDIYKPRNRDITCLKELKELTTQFYKNGEEKNEEMIDLTDALINICFMMGVESVKSSKELNQIIDTFLKGIKPNAYIELSTIHCAKGLESDEVLFLYTEMPKTYTKSWEKEQFGNLQYVAITRAKHTLYKHNFIFKSKEQTQENTETNNKSDKTETDE